MSNDTTIESLEGLTYAVTSKGYAAMARLGISNLGELVAISTLGELMATNTGADWDEAMDALEQIVACGRLRWDAQRFGFVIVDDEGNEAGLIVAPYFSDSDAVLAR